MQIIPWDRFEIATSLSRDALVARLQEHMDAPTLISSPISRAIARFEGVVEGDTFQLKRRTIIPLVRMPVIHGRVVPTDDGARLEVQIVPDTMLMLLQAGLFAVLSVTIFETGRQVFPFVAVMIALAWFLSISGFWFDAGESRRRLEVIADAGR